VRKARANEGVLAAAQSFSHLGIGRQCTTFICLWVRGNMESYPYFNILFKFFL